jgi:porin
VTPAEAATADEPEPIAPSGVERDDPEVEERSSASSMRTETQFGGPDNVENLLRADREVDRSLLDRWEGWKDGLQGKRGLSFSVDYSAVYLGADHSPGEDDAGGGMVRFFGAWDLTGRGSKITGALVWKVEHRNAYTNVPPSDFGFDLGYIGIFEPPFSDQGLRLTNLYWRQRWRANTPVTAVGGWVDVTDYLDVYALASPWTGFSNFAFSTGSNTIPVPDEGLGVAAAAMLTDKVFLIGGLADSNSDPTDPLNGFDTFFGDREYFKHIEIGWTPSHGQVYLDNAHLTIWHADDRTDAGTPGGWGANFSFTRHLKERWLPFVRVGYAEDGGSLMQKSVSIGFGYQRNRGQSLLGVGVNWGEPNETTFGPGLDDQYTAEVFYRWQIAREVALTPDLQYLKNPALNTGQNSIWVFGLRARFVF